MCPWPLAEDFVDFANGCMAVKNAPTLISPDKLDFGEKEILILIKGILILGKKVSDFGKTVLSFFYKDLDLGGKNWRNNLVQ